MSVTAGADGTARNLNGVGVTYFLASATKITQAWVVSAWQDIGFRIVRVQCDVKKVIPNQTVWTTGPTAWTWTALDSAIQQANAAGLIVIACVQGFPSYRLTSPFGVKCASGPAQFQASPADVAYVAGAFAARYNGGVNGFADCIELMNEDLSLSGNAPSCNGGALLAPMLIAGYNAIKAQQPLICVGCAAILSQQLTGVQQWFQPLFDAGCGSILEQGYANYHFYKNQNTPWLLKPGNVNFESYAQTMNNTARQNGFNRVLIAATEFGWPINTNFGRSPSSVVSQALQSSYFLYELEALKVMPYVQFACVYTLDDTSDGMSLVQGAGPPPSVTFNQAYFDVKAWIAQNGDWIGKPDGTVNVCGRDGIQQAHGRDGAKTVYGRDGLISIVTP